MQINNLEKFTSKVRSGKLACEVVITFNDPSISELAADAGFDFAWLDLEHSPFTLTDAANHIMALRGTDCAPFVRVTWKEHGIIKPISDLALAGVIIPMVRTGEDMRAGIMVGDFAENMESWKHRKLDWAALTTYCGALFNTARRKICLATGECE